MRRLTTALGPIGPVASTPSRPHAPPPAAATPIGEQLDRDALMELLTQQQRIAQAGLMTSGLAHEVSSHLQFLSGVAWLARDSGDPAEWAAALEAVQERCRVAAETVRSFLAFVRRREDVCHGSFRMSSVVEQAARLVEPLAHTSRVVVSHTTEDDAEIRGEQRLAIQVVVNLLSNAIRACAAGGGTVHVIAKTPAPGRARIIVRDTGPGIPPELRSSMFRPFATSHGKSGGTGLGLFLVRQIVLDFGGTIRTSTSTKGTSFQIDLPTKPLDGTAPSA